MPTKKTRSNAPRCHVCSHLKFHQLSSLIHSSPPPAFGQHRRQTSDSYVQGRIQNPFATQSPIKLNANDRDTSPPSAHVPDEVAMRPERTESILQTSVEYQACDDARQEGVPLCLRPGSDEGERGRAFCWWFSVGRDGVYSICFCFRWWNAAVANGGLR